MDQIDDEDVDEELERLRKLDRLQSETPDEIRATEHNSNRHKQLDDNCFIGNVQGIIESAAGLCVEYGAVADLV